MTQVLAVPAGIARLRSLGTEGFRNLVASDVPWPDEGGVIVGANGQGKSNLLEAIHYFSVFRSARGAPDRDLIQFGAQRFVLCCEIGGPSASRLVAAFERGAPKKTLTRDGVPCASVRDVLGALPSVLVSPRDVILIAGEPAERRRFLDVLLALTEPTYLPALQRYRGALSRRNALLRTGRLSQEGEVRAWEQVVAESGAVVAAHRTRWASEAAAHFSAVARDLGEPNEMTLRYRPSALGSEWEGGESAAAQYLAAFERLRAAEWQRGTTLAGPHRDDLVLALAGHPLRAFGSAGQQRTAALALRMLESDALRETHGAGPLLLLDDPFAELDEGRANALWRVLRNRAPAQLVLAVPREHDIPSDLAGLDRWRIVAGELRVRA